MSGQSPRLAAVGLATLALGCPPQKDPTPPKTYESLEHAEVAEVSEMVREYGVPIVVERVEVEVASEETAQADMVADLEIAVRRTHFDVMFHLREVLEAYPRYGQVQRLKDVIAASRLPNNPVYYAAERKALVFRQAWQKNLDGVRPWTAHHLVYASHDQAPGGLVQFLVDQGALLDDIRVRQCLLEGQARLVEVAIAIRPDGHTLHDVEIDALLQPPASFAGGEIDTPCEAGVRWLKQKYDEHGWENVVTAVRQPPDSTEQLLHPEKIGVDFESHVGLPRWPKDAGEATMLHDDVIGELTIMRLLRERGIEDKQATLAAVGWDGDRLRVFATGAGKRVLVWRSVWDRDKDALQFAQAVAPKKAGTPHAFRVTQTGRVVDCISAESDELAKLIADGLAAVADMDAAEAADIRTTEAVEAKLGG